MTGEEMSESGKSWSPEDEKAKNSLGEGAEVEEEGDSCCSSSSSGCGDLACNVKPAECSPASKNPLLTLGTGVKGESECAQKTTNKGSSGASEEEEDSGVDGCLPLKLQSCISAAVRNHYLLLFLH